MRWQRAVAGGKIANGKVVEGMKVRTAPARLAWWAALALCSRAGAQPLGAEQASLLEQARAAAMRYADSLPDFLCTETVWREVDQRGTNNWRLMDTLTVRLSYSGHRENYKLMEIDGKPTPLGYEEAGGVVSTGEFGTTLYSIFDPRSKGEFRWKGWTTMRERRAARFTYRIAREDSIYVVRWGRNGPGQKSVVVGYHGEVDVDEETHLVLRLTLEAEIPGGFPIDGNDCTVEYAFAEVAGKRYLLPAHARVMTRSGRLVSRNSVEFREYRKFQADTTIIFEAPPEKR